MFRTQILKRIKELLPKRSYIYFNSNNIVYIERNSFGAVNIAFKTYTMGLETCNTETLEFVMEKLESKNF